MLTSEERRYLDTQAVVMNTKAEYMRPAPWGEPYTLSISKTRDGVTISGTVQTLDELTFVVDKMTKQLANSQPERVAAHGQNKSGQAGHEPTEDVAATAEPVTA